MTNSHKQILNVQLADGDPESIGNLPVRIQATDFSVALFPEGFGDFASAQGHGCPVSLEFYRGRLRLIVFPDINTEDPMIIDLDGAKEDRRSVAGTYSKLEGRNER